MTEIIDRQIIGDGATWMCSAQPNAPKSNGGVSSNGQLLQILDAVLVNGFNPNVSTGAELLPNGFVKIKFGTAVDYRKRQKILISGANDAELNGEHIITEIIGNDAVIKAPDVTVVTGDIRAKIAPLGWESIFGSSDPLKRAYRSKNPNSTQTVIYLDMTMLPIHGYHATKPAHRAMITLCEDMAELGVPINPYSNGINDYSVNPSGSLFWYQARSYSKTAELSADTNNRWTVVGNGDYFYFINEWVSYKSGATDASGLGRADMYGFGDFNSFAGATDEWCCALFCENLPNDFNTGNIIGATTGSVINKSGNKFMIASANGVQLMPPFSLSSGGSGVYSSGNIALLNYPNPTTNSMVCFDLYAVSQNALRAKAPRIAAIQHNITAPFKTVDSTFIDNYLIVALSASSETSFSSTTAGYFAFDMGD